MGGCVVLDTTDRPSGGLPHSAYAELYLNATRLQRKFHPFPQQGEEEPRNDRISRHLKDTRRKWANFGPFSPKIRNPFYGFQTSKNDFSVSGMGNFRMGWFSDGKSSRMTTSIQRKQHWRLGGAGGPFTYCAKNQSDGCLP